MTPLSAQAFRACARVAFWLATLALLTATHWPGLAVEGPVDRTDLIVHAVVYAVWTTLLALGYRMPAKTLLPIALAFAAFDESTQPLFGRTFDWLDLLADALGVVIGAGVSAFLRPRMDAMDNPRADRE